MMPQRQRTALYYDLEGPISGQDHAQAVCNQFVEDGEKLFPVLSRYVLSSYILPPSDEEGYEPGDTLRFLIPFLVVAGVTEKDLREVSAQAGIVPGIIEFFTEVQRDGCTVRIISTSYEQHAFSVAKRIGLPKEQVYCTKFPLDQLREKVTDSDEVLIREVRERAVELCCDDLESKDTEMMEALDPFFLGYLPQTELGQAINEVKVIGGRRKVWALEEAVQANGGFHLGNAFVVGDSVTDSRMAQVVESAGGIALAWNANWYLLPYATCGVAAADAQAVKPLFEAWREGGRAAVREIIEAIGVAAADAQAVKSLFEAWREGGRAAVREIIEAMPKPQNSEEGPYYQWLAGRNNEFYQEALSVHERLRAVCRGAETAKLG